MDSIWLTQITYGYFIQLNYKFKNNLLGKTFSKSER